jgi:uncharacterized protein (DUF1697 family)
MTQCIALLRGVNVGKAKRIAMSELRGLVEELGGSEVRTLLNSGNVVFKTSRRSQRALASALEKAIVARCGFSVPVVVLGDTELDTIVAGNPLPQADKEPSKFLVAFVNDAAVLTAAKPLLAESWKPDALALGSKAAYIWCAKGILESRAAKEFARVTKDAATARNWATVLKLQQLCADGRG